MSHGKRMLRAQTRRDEDADEQDDVTRAQRSTLAQAGESALVRPDVAQTNTPSHGTRRGSTSTLSPTPSRADRRATRGRSTWDMSHRRPRSRHTRRAELDDVTVRDVWASRSISPPPVTVNHTTSTPFASPDSHTHRRRRIETTMYDDDDDDAAALLPRRSAWLSSTTPAMPQANLYPFHTAPTSEDEVRMPRTPPLRAAVSPRTTYAPHPTTHVTTLPPNHTFGDHVLANDDTVGWTRQNAVKPPPAPWSMTLQETLRYCEGQPIRTAAESTATTTTSPSLERRQPQVSPWVSYDPPSDPANAPCPPWTVQKMHYGDGAWQDAARTRQARPESTWSYRSSESNVVYGSPYVSVSDPPASFSTTTAYESKRGAGRERSGRRRPVAVVFSIEEMVKMLLERDYSGFANRAVDCYACSVLTMLLRSPRFRQALSQSPYVQLWHRYKAMRALPHDAATRDEALLAKMRTVLQVNVEGVTPTVHAALVGFMEAQKTCGELRRRLSRVQHDVAACEAVVHELVTPAPYTTLHDALQGFLKGISLAPIVPFFNDVFFKLEQEDAHELLVCLLTRLEEECVNFAKYYASTFEETTQPESAGAPHDAPSAAWVNTLMQGRMLNIVRCGNPRCKHEIVTVESFVNVSVSIDNTATADGTKVDAVNAPPSPVTTDVTPAVTTNAPDVAPTVPAAEPPVPTPGDTAAAPAAAVTEPTCPAVAAAPKVEGETECKTLLSQLLRRSVDYSLLEDYKCDLCGRKTNQFQGGCFYGTPPPVLVVQVKRFLQRFSKGHSVLTKLHDLVWVDDPLVVYFLPTTADAHTGDAGVEYYDEANKRFHDVVYAKEAAWQLHRRERGNEVPPSTSPPCAEDVVGDAGHDTDAEPCEDGDDRSSTGSSTSEEARLPDSMRIDAIRTVYRLQSTVLHMGRALNSGHYVAEFAEEEDKVPAAQNAEETSPTTPHDGPAPAHTRAWKMANDAVVFTTLSPTAGDADDSIHCMRSKGCYLALYEKVSEERVRCPVWRVLPDTRHLSYMPSDSDQA